MVRFHRSFVGRDQPGDCPDATRLKELLDEALPSREQTTLTAHLDGCRACQERLETLAGGPIGVAPLPTRLGPCLARVMEEMRDLIPTEAPTSDLLGAEAYESEDAPLTFLQPALEPGHLGRFGPYAILEVLGRGGMGVVLKGIDASLQRIVAIKVLAPELAASGAARKRFAREARAAAAICHDHVVPIYAVETAHGLPYLVMQYVPGLSLQQRLDRDGPLQLDEILRIGMQSAAGLAAAHAQGLIHRDIKPANLLLENGVERVRLTDFSLARAVDDASVTRSGFLAGTPAYMAPEQARGDAIDHRADLFSLGSVLYAMATARPPFRASTTLALLRRVSEDKPTPLTAINPSIPAWMETLMNRLLNKDPARRFQSAHEVADTLSSCLAHVHNPRLHPLPAWLQPQPRHTRPRLLSWGLLAAATVLCCFLAVGMVMRLNTPQGTLVIEVNDPEVQVTVDDQEVTLTGKTIGELKLKPGSYKVQVSKEGKPLKTQIAQVERGGRTLVTVTLEPKSDAVASTPTPALQPCALVPHDQEVCALGFSNDSNYLISGSKDGVVQLHSTRSGKLVRVLKAHRSRIVTATFLTCPELFLTLSDDGMMNLWEMKQEKPLTALKLGDRIAEAKLLGESSQVIGVAHDRLCLWDIDTGKKVADRAAPTRMNEWSVTPDGRQMAIVSDNELRLYMLKKTDSELRWASTAKEPPATVTFSPDGKLLFTTSKNQDTVVWDTITGKRLRLFIGQTGAASSDGRILATVENDAKLILWDLESGKSLVSFLLPKATHVTRMLFSPDRKWLVWATSDGKVILLSLDALPVRWLTEETRGKGTKLVPAKQGTDPRANAALDYLRLREIFEGGKD